MSQQNEKKEEKTDAVQSHRAIHVARPSLGKKNQERTVYGKIVACQTEAKMRLVINAFIVGSAALGVAGAFDKFLPKVKVGPVSIPAYLGAGLGAGVTLFLLGSR